MASSSTSRAKNSKKPGVRQTTIQVKEIKVRPKIEEHDMAFKLKNTRRFLGEGDKVKISVIFRGREIAHTDRGFHFYPRWPRPWRIWARWNRHPKLEGRNLSMIVTPK